MNPARAGEWFSTLDKSCQQLDWAKTVMFGAHEDDKTNNMVPQAIWPGVLLPQDDGASLAVFDYDQKQKNEKNIRDSIDVIKLMFFVLQLRRSMDPIVYGSIWSNRDVDFTEANQATAAYTVLGRLAKIWGIPNVVQGSVPTTSTTRSVNLTDYAFLFSGPGGASFKIDWSNFASTGGAAIMNLHKFVRILDSAGRTNTSGADYTINAVTFVDKTQT